MMTQEIAVKNGLYLEDLSVGQEFESREFPLDAEQIIKFAREFDPQPFHTDPEAAKDTFFQGLAASGWHTMAITMRLMTESFPLAKGLIGAGGEISWPQATRPGDVLRVKTTVGAIKPSRSKPDRGMITANTVTLNQRNEVLQKLTTTIVVFRRPE